jgi:hypothetical protein
MEKYILDFRIRYSESRKWPRDRVENEPGPDGNNNEELGRRKR